LGPFVPEWERRPAKATEAIRVAESDTAFGKGYAGFADPQIGAGSGIPKDGLMKVLGLGDELFESAISYQKATTPPFPRAQAEGTLTPLVRKERASCL